FRIITDRLDAIAYLCAFEKKFTLRFLLFAALLFLPVMALAQADTVTAPPEAEGCAYLKAITVSGRHKTKDAVVLRELSVQAGDCIPEASVAATLEQNRLRLMNLRLFNDVKISWVPVAADTFAMDIYLLD